MKMIEVKTVDLVGAALDWAVSKAVCDERVSMWGKSIWTEEGPQAGHGYCGKTYSPSTDWAQGGPLIEKYEVMICYPSIQKEDPWEASCRDDMNFHDGQTPLISAMRAIVAAKLGDTVSVPAELL